MANKDLRDRNGNIIGMTRDVANGRTQLLDKHGRQIGFYDAERDETRTASGGLVGPGNLLMTLLN